MEACSPKRSSTPRSGRAPPRSTSSRSPTRSRTSSRCLSRTRPAVASGSTRSEERRVGKEGRYRWAPDHLKKKKKKTDNTTNDDKQHTEQEDARPLCVAA